MQDHTSSPSLENAIALQKFGVGQPVRRKEDDTLVPRQGQIHRRFQPARPGLCVDRALQPCPRDHPRDRHLRRQGDARRARRLDRQADLDAAGYGPFTCGLPLKNRDGSPLLQTNRTRADDRQGALCRRSRRLRGRRDAGAGARCRRSGRARHRAAARGDRARGSREARRAAALRSHPEQRRAGLSLWRHRQGRGRVRRAAHVTKLDIVNTRVAVVAMEPRAALAAYDKASERYTIQVPTQGVAGNRVNLAKNLLKRADRQGARADRQCRRLVRHEEHQLSRIHLHPARGEGARPAGEMDRRALDQLPVRQPRPRAADSWRTGARRRGQVPRGAPHRLRQSRRLHHRRRAEAAVAQHRQEPRQRLSHAADGGRHQDGAHQHHADGRLSRRRTARGQLLHGAADRPRRRRDGHRPADLAQAQPHQAGANAVRGRLRHHLRQRRFPGRLQQGAGDFRPRRISPSARRKAASAASCAASRHRLLSRSHRAAERRTRQDPLRAGRLGDS